LYLNGHLTYRASRTHAAQNGNLSFVPYRGDIYTFVGSVNYAANARTLLRATYSFSRAGFGRNNSDTGLPLGLDYTRHAVIGGVTYRFSKRITTSLQYGFYRYAEPTSGGANDYTAHSVFSAVTYQWQ